MICKNCGTYHRGQRALPGSGWIELVLWITYLVPGLIYSIWRRGGKPTCPACGSRDLVDDASPIGRQLLHQHYPSGPPAPLPPAPPTEPNPIVHYTTAVLLGGLLVVLLGTAGAVVWATALR